MTDAKHSAPQQALARQRAQLIMQVRSGVLSVQEAARQLRVSRKTYYKWERRALAAMIEALGDREAGRPSLPIDSDKQALQCQTRELEAKLAVLEQSEEIRRRLETSDKKKHETAEMIITTLSQLKTQVHWPYKRLCSSTGLSYASFCRWKRRLDCGQPAFFKPGPRKVAPLRLEDLRTVLCHLKHGHQRSGGVGSVYQQYRDQISRC
jgi:transposase